MNAERIESLAQQMLQAWDGAHCVPLPSTDAAGLTNDEAYAVAKRLHALRMARGERPVGWKIGFTNRSLWPRYGVDRPMWAPVWNTTTRLLEGHEARVSMQALSQPRIEPEIAFVFDVAPRAGMSLDELRGCLAWVAHAFEIVHTHYEGWRFTPADTAADFALHGRLFVGPRVAVPGWGEPLAGDLSALCVELLCNGEVKDRGVGSVVLDGPLQALKTLIDSMGAITPHWHVAAGDVITTGTLTDAWPLAPGQHWTTRLSDRRLSPLSLHVDA